MCKDCRWPGSRPLTGGVLEACAQRKARGAWVSLLSKSCWFLSGSGLQMVMGSNKIGASVRRPLSCLSIESILHVDEAAAHRGRQQGQAGRHRGAREQLPLSLRLGREGRAQSCGAKVSVAGYMGDVERGPGSLAGTL